MKITVKNEHFEKGLDALLFEPVKFKVKSTHQNFLTASKEEQNLAIFFSTDHIVSLETK